MEEKTIVTHIQTFSHYSDGATVLGTENLPVRALRVAVVIVVSELNALTAQLTLHLSVLAVLHVGLQWY